MISVDCDVFVSTPEYEMKNIKAGELTRKDGRIKFVAMTRFGDRHHGFTSITSVKNKIINGEMACKVTFVNMKGVLREMVTTNDHCFFTRMKGLVAVGRISSSDVLMDIEGYLNKMVSRERVPSEDYCFCDVSIENNNSIYANGMLTGCVYDAVKPSWKSSPRG